MHELNSVIDTLYFITCRDDDDADENQRPSSPQSLILPPDYTLTTIAPPVYQDALQDIIVSPATGTDLHGPSYVYSYRILYHA